MLDEEGDTDLLLGLWGSLGKLIPALKNSLIDSTLHEILSYSFKENTRYSIMTRTLFLMHTLCGDIKS